MRHIVLSIISDDKPGLVQKLSSAVFACGGSWQESRMSQLAGKFAGIARVSLPAERFEELQQALNALQAEGITISIEDCQEQHSSNHQVIVSLIGQDRPGIVQELGAALASLNINIEELNTGLGVAAMTAEALFNAEATLSMPTENSIDLLQEKLDEISERLNVDIVIEQVS